MMPVSFAFIDVQYVDQSILFCNTRDERQLRQINAATSRLSFAQSLGKA
jgi:hypothetical protein